MSLLKACILINPNLNASLSDSDISKIQNELKCNITSLSFLNRIFIHEGFIYESTRKLMLMISPVISFNLPYNYLIDFNGINKIPMIIYIKNNFNELIVINFLIDYYQHNLPKLKEYPFYMLFLIELDDSFIIENINDDMVINTIRYFYRQYKLNLFFKWTYVFYDYKKNISIIINPKKYKIERPRVNINTINFKKIDFFNINKLF